MQQTPTSVKLEDVCCEKNLYELRDSNGSIIAQNHIENAFGRIEDYTARVIKSIIAKSQNENCLKCSTVLSQDEKSFLTIFITALMYRDPQTIVMGMRFLQENNPNVDCRNARNFTLMNLLPLSGNPEWDNKTIIRSAIETLSGMFFQIGFTDNDIIITSDRPVIQWPSHDSSDHRPRAVAFPLTSRLVLYLFPIESAEQNESSCFFKMSEQQINDIQTNIAVCARRWIYSKSIMAALIEDILFGTDQIVEQPEAIFVWLSDSPQLNAQSKDKIDVKADKIRFGQCVTIEEESFDMETLEEGHIYFLNTQKLGKKGKLSKAGDGRTWTIWETLENTAKQKADHLYFIIDEAHRGMQGTDAGRATTIMQKFLKGSPGDKLSPMPVVIGMSATTARFNKLIAGITSTEHKVVVTANEVRFSGLLKDRIILTYPENPTADGMSVLEAAAEDWKDKCLHWYQYSYEQHYEQVNPILLIQVLNSAGREATATDMGECISVIERRTGWQLHENEVVHTFGQTAAITANGLNIAAIQREKEDKEYRAKRISLFMRMLAGQEECLEFDPAVFTAFVEKVVVSGTKKDVRLVYVLRDGSEYKVDGVR